VFFCKSRSEFILKSNGNKTISSWSVRDIFNAKLSDLGLDAAKYDLHSFRSGAASITFLKILFKDTAGGGVLVQTTELYDKESLENFLYLEIKSFDNEC